MNETSRPLPATVVKAVTPATPGHKTTEFYVVIGVIVLAVVTAVLGDLSWDWAVTASSILAAIYSVARVVLKLSGHSAAVEMADDLAQAVDQQVEFALAKREKALPVLKSEGGFMHPCGCGLLLVLALAIALGVALTGCGTMTATKIEGTTKTGYLTHAEAAKQGYTFYGRNQDAWWMQPIVFLDGLRQWEGDGFTTQREESR